LLAILLVRLEVHLDLRNRGIDLREFLLQRPQVRLGRLGKFDNFVEFDDCRFFVGFELGELLRRNVVRLDLGRHLATDRTRPSHLGGTALLGNVAVERDDTPPLTVDFAGRDRLRDVPERSDERVFEDVAERGSINLLFRSDEIEQSVRVGRGPDWREIELAEPVESDAGSATDVVLAEMVKDRFSGLAGVDNEGLESRGGGGRNGDVVLVVDPAEVAEPALCVRCVRIGAKRALSRNATHVEAGQATLLFELEDRRKDVPFRLTRLLGRLGLDRLFARVADCRALLVLGCLFLLHPSASLLDPLVHLFPARVERLELLRLLLGGDAVGLDLLLDSLNVGLDLRRLAAEVFELLRGDLDLVLLRLDLLVPRRKRFLVLLNLEREAFDLVCGAAKLLQVSRRSSSPWWRPKVRTYPEARP
jgi:hypothetical protein